MSVELRDFILEHFSRDELMTFCADYFRDFYLDFEGSNDPKSSLIQKLIGYCERRGELDNLRAGLQQARPGPYEQRFGRIAVMPVRARQRDPRRIFLSHAHQDAKFAQRLATDLRAQGFDVWIAPDSIQPGENWVRAIGRGLSESGTYVVALTPQAVISPYVQQETEYALQQHNAKSGRLIPMLVKACNKDQLSPLLHTLQHVNFERNYDAGLASLLTSLSGQATSPLATSTQSGASLGGTASQPTTNATTPSGPVLTRRSVLLGAGGAAALGALAIVLSRVSPNVDTPAATARQGAADKAGELATQVAQGPNTTSVPTDVVVQSTDGAATGTPTTALPATSAASGGIDFDLAPGVSLECVRIPGGLFLMGSDKVNDKYARDAELPQHGLTLPDYYIGKTPVTNAQFAVFAKATGYTFKVEQRSGRETHPVVNVTWHTAIAFCTWLSQASGRAITLPSEAEWEKAARGTDGRIYPWGNQAPTDKLCNFNANIGDTTPVGRYSPAGDSPYGCVDMAGNVWEWTRSLWGDGSKLEFTYPYTQRVTEREDLTASDDVVRVVRGGSWNYDQANARAAYRSWRFPERPYHYLGFRVVCAPVLPTM